MTGHPLRLRAGQALACLLAFLFITSCAATQGQPPASTAAKAPAAAQGTPQGTPQGTFLPPPVPDNSPDRTAMAAAEQSLARQDYAGAAPRLEGLLKASPGSLFAPLARLKLAYAYMRLSRYGEAAELLRAASPESRSRVEVLLMLSEAEEGAGRLPESFGAAQEALLRAGERPVARTCQQRLKAVAAHLTEAQAAGMTSHYQGYAAGVLALTQARAAAKAGRNADALKLLDAVQRDQAGTDLATEAQQLAKQLSGEGRGAAASPSPKRYTIGVLIPQEGAFQAVGLQVLKGVALAVGIFGGELAGDASQDAFKDTSKGAPLVRLAVRDCGKGGAQAAQALADLAEDDAVAVVGLFGAAHAEAAGRAAQRLKLPLLALCQDPRLPVGGGVFRNFITPRQQVERLAAYARERGWTSLAILYPRDRYGQDMAAVMRTAAPVAGLKVVAEASYDPAQPNYIAALKQLATPKKKGKKPEAFQAVFIPEGPQKAVAIIAQLADRLRGVACLGPNLWNDARLTRGLGETNAQVYFADVFDAGSNEPAVRGFVAGYNRAYNEEPGYLAAQGYDDALIVMQAVERGASGGEQMIRALAGTKGFEGVTGRTSLAASGEVSKALQVFTVQAGRITSLP